MPPVRPSSRRARVPGLLAPPVVLVAGLLAVAGCGGRGVAADQDQGSGVSVVASTDVWGDVARTVAGHDAVVTSLVDDPSQDPHSFEASARSLLAVARADVVVENGGGYDAFMPRLLDTSGSGARVVDAVRVSGRASVDGEPNEHVWYDVRAVAAVADRLATELGRVDPSHAAGYTSRARAFGTRLAGLEAREAACEARRGGRRIAVTEPVPLYLTAACGLTDVTPPAFTRAVEEGEDVSLSVLEQTLDLVRSGDVAALVYNTQTTGAVTERVLAAARTAGVPVVPVTETLPAGEDYVGWMGDTLTHLEKAVAR